MSHNTASRDNMPTALALPIAEARLRGAIGNYYMIESVFIVIHKTVFSIITCSLGLRSKSTGRDLIFSREEWG